jgi:NAD(P)-dependent dehydrogenase (short-subunit alcohol dehydrogenase family)
VSLESKVVVVTGAGMGIGRQSALAFAAAGAKVVVADYDEQAGSETVALVHAAGGDAAFVRVDVRVESDVAAMADFAVERYGSLDFAHNNAGGRGAGGAGGAPTHELSEAEWDALVGLNLKAAWLCMKHELRHMLPQGRGSIVNTSSSAAYRPSLSMTWYAAAKHGLTGLTKATAHEYATRGIRVNAVAPGVTETEMVVGMYGQDGAQQLAERLNPIGRLVQPTEIAAAVVWLCGDAAGAITGVILPVDGGQSTV